MSEHTEAWTQFLKEQHNGEFIAAVKRLVVHPDEVLALMYDPTRMDLEQIHKMLDAVRSVVPDGVKVCALPSGVVEAVVISAQDG